MLARFSELTVLYVSGIVFVAVLILGPVALSIKVDTLKRLPSTYSGLALALR